MQAYILSLSGAVLLSAVLSAVLPDGRLAPLIRGMAKLITLILLISPVISLLRGTAFSAELPSFSEDAAFLSACTQRAEREEELALEEWLQAEYGIAAEAEVDLWEDGSYSAKSVSVRISDFGIYAGEAHIDISLQIEAALENKFGCEAEILS